MNSPYKQRALVSSCATSVGLLIALNAPPALASEALMEKSGCISCHRVTEKLIGPSFRDVAMRYRNQPEILSVLKQRVREGNEGEWGDIPMAANSATKVPDAELETILQWVLSLQ